MALEKLKSDGWRLNISKTSTSITTSLYNDSSTFIESMSFNLSQPQDISIFREYVILFKEDPSKNLKKMTNLRVR